jgi:hypothetical protein
MIHANTHELSVNEAVATVRGGSGATDTQKSAQLMGGEEAFTKGANKHERWHTKWCQRRLFSSDVAGQ